jgi:hypothetical protein
MAKKWFKQASRKADARKVELLEVSCIKLRSQQLLTTDPNHAAI